MLRIQLVIPLCLALIASPVLSAPSPVFPAGTRASVLLSSTGTASFGLEATGPSVLWIELYGEGLAEVNIDAGDAWSSVMARHAGGNIGSRAELTVPVYATGTATVNVTGRPGSRVQVTSSYGFGSVVTMRDLLDAAMARDDYGDDDDENDDNWDDEEELVDADDLKDRNRDEDDDDKVDVDDDDEDNSTVEKLRQVSSEKTDSAPVTDEAAQATVSDEGTAASEPSMAAEKKEMNVDMTGKDEPAPETSEPAASQPVKAEPVEHDKSRLKGILFGEGAEGMLTADMNQRTYRFYVPNSEPFRVIVWGDVDVTLSSHSGSYSTTLSRHEKPKTIGLSSGIESLYFVSVRGEGRYTIEIAPQ